MRKIVSVGALLLLGLLGVKAEKDSSPSYKIRDSHVLETPISNKEMENWAMFNSTIMLKNVIVLSPEIKNAKGGLLNNNVLP